MILDDPESRKSRTATGETQRLWYVVVELWAAVTDQEPNGIQEVGSSTVLGSASPFVESSVPR